MAVETVSIVVPTYGRPETLAAALDSLLGANHPSGALQLIIIDDAGGNPQTELVVRARQGRHPVAPVLVHQDRRGAAAARNRGARMAEGDILLFCDDDVIVEPDHVQRHLESHHRYPRSLVNGVWEFAPAVYRHLISTPFGRYRLALERQFQAEADEYRHCASCVETQFVTAMNLSVPRELFWEVGGFDETFPFAGAEDQDLSIRARMAGATLLRNHEIRVLNNEPIVTFDAFCMREERSAQTLVVLARKLPDHAGDRAVIARNGPVAGQDPPSLVAVKLLKAAASRPVLLRTLHALVAALERWKLSDRRTWYWYRRILALHIFRGVRTALRQT